MQTATHTRSAALSVVRCAVAEADPNRLGVAAPFHKAPAGHTTLTALMLTGNIPPIIATKLAEALKVGQGLIDAVLAATARQQHDEARARILETEGALEPLSTTSLDRNRSRCSIADIRCRAI